MQARASSSTLRFRCLRGYCACARRIVSLNPNSTSAKLMRGWDHAQRRTCALPHWHVPTLPDAQLCEARWWLFSGAHVRRDHHRTGRPHQPHPVVPRRLVGLQVAVCSARAERLRQHLKARPCRGGPEHAGEQAGHDGEQALPPHLPGPCVQPCVQLFGGHNLPCGTDNYCSITACKLNYCSIMACQLLSQEGC